jgi:hypothetical protein
MGANHDISTFRIVLLYSNIGACVWSNSKRDVFFKEVNKTGFDFNHTLYSTPPSALPTWLKQQLRNNETYIYNFVR